MFILHVYSNKIFISLPTQPPTHTHKHISITLDSTQPTTRKPEKQTQQQDRRTQNQHNPATQSTQSSNPESKQTQQPNPHNPPGIDALP